MCRRAAMSGQTWVSAHKRGYYMGEIWLFGKVSRDETGNPDEIGMSVWKNAGGRK